MFVIKQIHGFFMFKFVHFKVHFDFAVTFLISRSIFFAGELLLITFKKIIHKKADYRQNFIPTIPQIEMIIFS